MSYLYVNGFSFKQSHGLGIADAFLNKEKSLVFSNPCGNKNVFGDRMKKNKIEIFFALFIFFIGCKSNNLSSTEKKENDYGAVLIPEDNIDYGINFEKNMSVLYDDTLKSSDYSCNINSACIKKGVKVEEGNITFIEVKKDDKTVFKKTRDVDFKTKSGLTIKDPVIKLLELYSSKIFVEPGTCLFLQLEDGWRACIAMADMTVRLEEPVLYFYKVDSGYSRAMTLKEWNDFIAPKKIK